MTRHHTWPERFIWGVSTSAHQYDGNNVASDYWAIEHLGVPVFAEPSGDALNSYHLWRDDMRLAADLGFTGYRFGIEWARIEPAPGRYSDAELGRYRTMVEHCRGLGLEPVVTLHHITHPAWFTAAGGWIADGAADRFSAYVDFVAPALTGVSWVTTINEPNYLATLGGLGQFLRTEDPAALYRSMARDPRGVLGATTLAEPDDTVVVEALIAAHRAARDTPHQRCDAAVGWTIATQAFRPAPGGEATCARYREAWEDRFLRVARDDDWLGVQSYTSQRIGPDGPAPPPPDAELTQLGWAFRPDALGIAVRHAASIAPHTPIIVTENGIPTADDTRRVAFIDEALDALHVAIGDGVDVRGYFHWTFIDNFEWTRGYAPTFGLVAADRRTFARIPKPSARHLGELARTAAARRAGR
jgi:beta-glucosidase